MEIENPVKLGQKFFIIHNESFFYENPESVRKEVGEKERLVQYQWVIPVYVKSIRNNFDGIESFDLCPVDVSTLESRKSGWCWSREFEYEQIGESIFHEEEDCWKLYRDTFTKESIEVFEEFRRLRFLQEKESSFI
jgi:hypothetical protein